MDTDNESDSSVLVGTPTAQKRRKSRSKKQKTNEQQQTAINSAIEARRARTDERDASSDSSSSPPRSPAKKKGRKKNSPVWNHCHTKEIGGKTVTFCNYCVNTHWILGGSTSTALYHIKQHHIDKLTPDELFSVNQKAKGTEQTSPSSKLPARSPHTSLYRKIPHSSPMGRDINIKFVLAMISSSTPFNILDVPEWGVFLETLSSNQYHLPSRMYMN